MSQNNRYPFMLLVNQIKQSHDQKFKEQTTFQKVQNFCNENIPLFSCYNSTPSAYREENSILTNILIWVQPISVQRYNVIKDQLEVKQSMNCNYIPNLLTIQSRNILHGTLHALNARVLSEPASVHLVQQFWLEVQNND